MKQVCPFCSKEFDLSKHQRHRIKKGGVAYCSITCSQLQGSLNRRLRIKKICESCGEIFYRRPCEIKSRTSKYCSIKCKGLGSRNKQTLACLLCGTYFSTWPSQIKDGRAYCSVACYGKAHSGENSVNWKGGISSARDRLYCSPAWIQAKRLVYKRDNRMCRLCYSKGVIKKGTCVHHIDTFVEALLLACDPGNMILLCNACHLGVKGKEKKWMKRFLALIQEKVELQAA